MKSYEKWCRVVLAILAGESMLVFLITVVQEYIFGGISFLNSSWFDIIFGGLGTFLSAFLAGVTAYLIVGQKTIVAHLILTGLIATESIWLVFFSGSADPVWFDSMASSSLLIGIWLGVLVLRLEGLRYGFKERANESEAAV